MPPSQKIRRSATVQISDWHTIARTALCADDKCPFKYRGVTMLATEEAARKHATESGHAVDIYLDSKRTVTP